MPFKASAGKGKKQFDYILLSGAVVGAATQAGIALGAPERLHAQSSLKLESALQDLMGGNQCSTTNQLTSIEDDLAVLREHTANKPESFAAVLACTDSRVPVELIFDQRVGQIFVCRVAGNVATSEIIACLEYGVAVLGVKTLLVLGHSCGREVKEALKADAVPGKMKTLSPHRRRAVEQSDKNRDKDIAAEAAIEVELLRTSSPVIADAIKKGRLKVEAGVYDLATGMVRLNAAADRADARGLRTRFSAAALLAGCLILNGGLTLQTKASARLVHADVLLQTQSYEQELHLTGKLTRTMAIGAETTGWMLELDPPANIEDKRVDSIQVSYSDNGALEKLKDKRVTASGTLSRRPGTESGEQLILAASSMTEATEPAGPSTTALNLSGSEWRLEDLAGSGLVEHSQATLAFPEAGGVDGYGSCNRFFGSAEIHGGTIRLGPLASSGKACSEAVMNQETKYLQTLQSAERYAWNNLHLLVYCQGHDKPLRFTRVTPPKNPRHGEME